jgi:hypothetical protein
MEYEALPPKLNSRAAHAGYIVGCCDVLKAAIRSGDLDAAAKAEKRIRDRCVYLAKG